MMLTFKKACLTGAVVALLGSAGAMAATPAKVTTKDYDRAVSFMRFKTQPLVDHQVRRVNWLDDTHFWYVDSDASGDHYRVMDAATGKVKPAFDQAALASALAAASDTKKVKADKLGVYDFKYLADGKLKVDWRGTSYVCDLDATPANAKKAAAGKCVTWASTLKHKMGDEQAVVSPNGKFAVFVRNWNLWLRNLETGAERPLTDDGYKNYGYATLNAGWIHRNGAIVRWSPDSTKVATYRQDQRKVGNMYMIETRVGHPKLHQWKYPLPGDKHVFMIEPVVIDIQTGEMTRLKMDPEQRLSTLCDTLACDDGEPNTWSDVKWAPDSKTLALVSTSRDRQHEWFKVANAETGAVRTVFEDSVKTYYESGRGRVNWQYLPKHDQAIWFSERSNWGNLYLRNLKTGKIEHAITKGPGNVDQVLRVDRDTRTLWFTGNARTPGINPYFKQFYKVDIDSGKTTLLTPEAVDHDITLSPDGKYFVDTWSTVTQPPVTVLRASSDGHVIATVAKTDISRLKAAGWVPPKVITVKARDGKTTLYGLMFKPTNFDPHKKYPVIDYIYPGPQTGSVFTFGWASARSDHQAMAELGFIVVAVNGMGTPWRTKSFHDTWYGKMGDNTLPDQVTAIKQLAKRHPWIDLSRVGIWGHSGGGNATADALFRYPDFFKVGWSESGNHDNRNYENDWGEKYQGLLVVNKDGTTNYDNQANQLIAKNLKGHLMLVHGSMDDNVPHGSTLLVVDALIKANKDFDMLILPNKHHGYADDTPYITRRRWDYFVRYLMGAEPPHEYKVHFDRH
ncbi:MAG TPA: DPP IV N-terminal domain-containing protein [Rhodanobacteraceae bacterium]|nr:DPP IV N-terminal domain-containing protein [Rhodanobacteraceae bacterium]